MSRRLSSMALLCTLLVVVIHLETVPRSVGSVSWAVGYFFRNILAIAAVPFFFLASGFFLARHVGERNWWRRAVVQRLRTLGAPYFFWCLVSVALFTFLWPVDICGGECGRVQLKASSLAAAFGFNVLTVPEAYRPFWYLRALFFLVLLSPCVAWAVRRWKAWSLFALFAFYWVANPGFCDSPDFWLSVRWQVFWRFGFSAEGLFYFAVGMFLWQNPMSFGRVRGLAIGSLGMVFGLIGMFARVKGWPGCVYLSSLSIPFTMCLLWSLAPVVRWPKGLSGNAFAIYVTHPLVIRALNASGVLPAVRCGSLLEWLSAVSLSVVLVVSLRRLLPKVASVAFGGR